MHIANTRRDKKKKREREREEEKNMRESLTNRERDSCKCYEKVAKDEEE